MTKRIGVLSERQDDDKYVLEAFDSYSKAEHAKSLYENDYSHGYDIEDCDFTYDNVRHIDFVVDGNDMTILTSFTTPIKVDKPYRTLNQTGYPIGIVITEFEDDCIIDYEIKGEENV